MLSGGGAPTISKVDLSSLFFATKRTRGVSFLPRQNWGTEGGGGELTRWGYGSG